MRVSGLLIHAVRLLLCYMYIDPKGKMELSKLHNFSTTPFLVNKVQFQLGTVAGPVISCYWEARICGSELSAGPHMGSWVGPQRPQQQARGFSGARDQILTGLRLPTPKKTRSRVDLGSLWCWGSSPALAVNLNCCSGHPNTIIIRTW